VGPPIKGFGGKAREMFFQGVYSTKKFGGLSPLAGAIFLLK